MIELSAKARELVSQNKVEIQMVVEIDGIDFYFGVTPVKSLWKIGDANIRIGDSNLFVGGIVISPNSKSLIDAGASQKTISQQLEIEKGVSSISTVKVRIVDENNLATKLFSPTATTDILGRGCTVYIGLKEASHPEDSIRIFDGMIDECSFGAGFADLSISHPEQFKRQAIFPKWEGELLTSIPSNSNPSPTVVTSLEGLAILPESHGFYNYFKLDTEVIKFTGITQSIGQLSAITSRSSFDTDLLSHKIGDAIESFYYINSHPLDLVLKLLCSKKTDESPFYVEGILVSQIKILPVGDYRLSLRCDANVIIKNNIQVGDTLKLYASGSGSHHTSNVGGANPVIVKSISFDGRYAFIQSDSTGLTEDLVNTHTFSATSKWNVLPDGCGIANRYIDFAEFERLRSLHSTEFANCEIFLKDTISDTKSFIDQVVLRPQGLYTLPRKGRISIGKTSPPIASLETKVFNEHNVLNAKSIQIKRSINRNFYNAVIFKYNEDPTEDKFLTGSISVDAQSFARIKVGNRPLLVEAKSLRTSADTTKVIGTQTKRLLERYKFAAETMTAVVDFATGINIDVGDTAICAFKNLHVSDITTGTREFEPRLMEVTNKEMNVSDARVVLELTSTIFEVDGRYATISPSSTIKAGATTSVLTLKKSQSRSLEINEKGKWDQYVGQPIIVRSPDWTVVKNSTILAIDPVSDAIQIEPIDITPPAGYIVESPKYDDTAKNSMSFWKRVHAYLNPTVKLVSLVAPNIIQVAPGNTSKFLSGAVLFVHSPNFNNISNEVSVLSVNTVLNQVTLNAALNYTAATNDLIDLIGFKDTGLPYRII